MTSDPFELSLPPGTPAASIAFTQQPQVQAGTFPQPISVGLHVTYTGGTVPVNQFVQFYLLSNASNATVTGAPATSLIPADGNITVNFADDLSTSAAGTFRLGTVVKVGGAFAISDPFTTPAPSLLSASLNSDTNPTVNNDPTTGNTIVQVGLGSVTTSFNTISQFPIYSTNPDGTPRTTPYSPDVFPPSYAVPDGQVPKSVAPSVAPGFTEVPDTSSWWSSLIFRRTTPAATDTVSSRDSNGNQLYPIYPLPLAAMVASGGLGLADLGNPTITPAPAPSPNFPAQTDPRARQRRLQRRLRRHRAGLPDSQRRYSCR